MTDLEALYIATVAVFLAGIIAGKRPHVGTRTHFLLTSPFYFVAFLVMSASPLFENYGFRLDSITVLFTLFISGTAGEKIAQIVREL